MCIWQRTCLRSMYRTTPSQYWDKEYNFLNGQKTYSFFFFNILFIYLFLYLFLAALGLRFCARASSSCGKRGPLFIAVRGPLHYRSLSCCRAQAPDAQAQQLWPTGPAAPRHVGSSQTRARIRVPCISRQTPNHCATREAQDLFFIKEKIKIFLDLRWGYFLINPQ